MLSIIWGWKVDKMIPARMDWFGTAIALAGVLVIMYAPRA
ncbi:hypothetical protein QT972_03810 [Microcoleus sp. herbarium7]